MHPDGRESEQSERDRESGAIGDFHYCGDELCASIIRSQGATLAIPMLSFAVSRNSSTLLIPPTRRLSRGKGEHSKEQEHHDTGREHR